MTPDRASVRPLFLDGSAGRLFAVHVSPAPDRDRGTLIVVPPFAEELNRCRRVITETTRALAAAGFGSLVVDLMGTGNSDGEFSDARWGAWRQDVLTAAAWLEERGRKISGLWGVRLGAILAAELVAAEPDRFPHLLLWQPVPSGRAHMVQFLRIRSAAAMAEGGDGKTIMRDLRAALADGEAVEVAGYELPGALFEEIEALSLKAMAIDASVSVDWLEIAANPDTELALPKQAILDAWRSTGADVSVGTVEGPPFWMIEDNVSVPSLVEETARRVQAWST